MASLNRVFLIGNLTMDPELRYIPNGTALTKLRLAVNRVYKTQTGEQKEDVCYINVVVWGKQAENCAEYLSKGSPIFVEGRLQNHSWETEAGEKRSIVEIAGERIQFLGKLKAGTAHAAVETKEEVSTEVSPPHSDVVAESDVPF